MPKKASKSKVAAAGKAIGSSKLAAKGPAQASPPKSKRGGRREGAGRKPKPRHHEEYSQLAGDVPDDPLKVIGWAQRVLALAMKKILEDPEMTEAVRRQELRATARGLANLVPLERLKQAEDLLRESAEDAGRDRKDPEMTLNAQSSTQPQRSLRLDS